MAVFQSLPGLALLMFSALLAFLCRKGIAIRGTGFFSAVFSGAYLVLNLMAGGTLYEGLIALLIPLILLLPKENAP